MARECWKILVIKMRTKYSRSSDVKFNVAYKVFMWAICATICEGSQSKMGFSICFLPAVVILVQVSLSSRLHRQYHYLIRRDAYDTAEFFEQLPLLWKKKVVPGHVTGGIFEELRGLIETIILLNGQNHASSKWGSGCFSYELTVCHVVYRLTEPSKPHLSLEHIVTYI